jgi:pSer/pThr/pTyr-binding forkhead associated (FHA) protein
MFLEDLKSANGTYVNRTRVYPGEKRSLTPDDVIQVGSVQLKIKLKT